MIINAQILNLGGNKMEVNIKTKYNIGDEVYYVRIANTRLTIKKITILLIVALLSENNTINILYHDKYDNCGERYNEDSLIASIDEIDARIDSILANRKTELMQSLESENLIMVML